MKIKYVHVCQECGHESPKWLGKCPACNAWSSFVEEAIVPEPKGLGKQEKLGAIQKPVRLKEIGNEKEDRLLTKIKELDRVLGGGIVEGSLVLVGGDPGIGKSTLLLQICQTIGEQKKSVLYISGEESIAQIKMRADRLGVNTDYLQLFCETDMQTIQTLIKATKPDLVIIDSIQTVYSGEISSSPGSVSQVREATHAFMNISKGLGICVILVGHVTKDGSLAGPRVLEHMVDTVLYFEGERHATFRILRAVKNRFGSTNEIGVFEMKAEGLMEVANPSELMLSGRPMNVSGSIVACSMEGTRPMLIEVQALVSYTSFGTARRTATGIDYNRVVILMAVLEKRAGMDLGSYDSYVNLAGGIKMNEPALDLGVVVAIASSFRDKVVDPYTIVFGEVGLTGEVRGVNMAEKRVIEAAKLGFKKCIMPKANLKGLKDIAGMKLYGVSNISEVLELIMR
ncbi:MAG TPA: DNA repair protein RadA [Epulopiscium sp.]|nr:DNA repair protein RadA [Candidatus Epulonipiscium sp.]